MSSSSSFHPHDDPEQDPPQCPFLQHSNNTAAQAQGHPSWHFLPTYHFDHFDVPDPSFTSGDTYEQDGSAFYFDNAYHTEPSPPAPNFLDNILNPVETNSFGYQFSDSNMPTSRGQGRPARLSNGYVDLTTDSPDVTTARSRKTQRDSPTPGPSAKRQRRNDGTAAQAESDLPAAMVEEIDLSSENKTVQHVLQKQREEAVKAQALPEEKATTFNTFNCVICMDTPTDLTATACGHLFCHTCLMEALIAGENRGNPGEQRRSQCPVCRKNINRSKVSDIIPLLLKKGLATQPKKTRPISASAATATASKVTS
ncbi:uncharacterized protein N0V89_006785 [Didymosphaeria variabile]|uniref:RING-type domain-containing protein n=1 Tax=Didymosphaeria variabile TaxID=1932322 RepID=A0A9W9C9M0_9PLEO|nr:uncharacterized protein N0V89_006785 [Didymosphaeria variabile]KAJ4351443.1 hypothetical protein N0V89_006785 [Didymosphaeria variabile]